jgi:pyridoxal/pyridoxine/pyridoxamine kinase
MPAANTCSPFDKLGVRIYCLVLSLPKDKRIVNILSVQSEVVAKPGIGEAIARMLLPLADIVTPNAFELTQLAALPVRNPDEAGTAAAQLGRPLVVATSIPDGVGRIGALASTRNECWFASTPRLENVPHGAGDLFAALFLTARLSGLPVAQSLTATLASVFHILWGSRVPVTPPS